MLDIFFNFRHFNYCSNHKNVFQNFCYVYFVGYIRIIFLTNYESQHQLINRTIKPKIVDDRIVTKLQSNKYSHEIKFIIRHFVTNSQN